MKKLFGRLLSIICLLSLGFNVAQAFTGGGNIGGVTQLRNILNQSDQDELEAEQQEPSTPSVAEQDYLKGGELIIPKVKHYVTDTADIFNTHVEAQLIEQIKKIEASTTAEIGVLTVLSTDGIEIAEYTIEVAHEWGIGKKDVDNGLMIVIAVADRQWFMASGYGVEGILPDLRLKKIGERHFPENFKTRNYFRGVSSALTEIEGFLLQDPEVISSYENQNDVSLKEIAFILAGIHLFLTLVVTSAYYLRRDKKEILGVGKPRVFFFLGAFLLIGLLLSAVFLPIYFFYFLASVGHGDSVGTGGWSSGGGWGGGSSGGFGGFGGGGFGGGGAGGSW